MPGINFELALIHTVILSEFLCNNNLKLISKFTRKASSSQQASGFPNFTHESRIQIIYNKFTCTIKDIKAVRLKFSLIFTVRLKKK